MLTCKECLYRQRCIEKGDKDAISGETSVKYCGKRITEQDKQNCLKLAIKVLNSDEELYVYRICPKCNTNHNESCKNCAWCGCAFNTACDVFGVWDDGQYPPERCTIVKYLVTWNRIPILMKWLGERVFWTKEDANKKLEELKK